MTGPIDGSQIERRILAATEGVTGLLSLRDADTIREYVDVGEYGVAVDLLVATIGHLPLPVDQFREISTLAREMGVDERWVRDLRSESSGDSATGLGVFRSRQFPGFPNPSLFAGSWSFDDVAEGARSVLNEARGTGNVLVRGDLMLVHGAYSSRTIAPRLLEIGVLVRRATDEIVAAFPRVPPPPEYLRPEAPHYQRLRTEVVAFLESVESKLPQSDLEAAKELATIAGEYGAAVEWARAALMDANVRLSTAEGARLDRLVKRLGIETRG